MKAMAAWRRSGLGLAGLMGAALLLWPFAAGAQGLGGGGGGTGGGSLEGGIANSYLAAPGAIFDLGSKFLRDNANQANASLHSRAALNPGGGGADMATSGEAAYLRYRAWFEGYASHSRTSAQNAFTGDSRDTIGGIAGLGAVVSPNTSVGLSVDQGHTSVKIRDLPQSTKLDLTQFGLNAVHESGPWTFTAAGIYGIGRLRSRRTDDRGAITASYDASLWGAIAEVSYYWSSGQWRMVPKTGVDWTLIAVDPFTESGGGLPVAATGQETRRLRAFAGAEIGYAWLAGSWLHDVSTYARAIQIVSQHVDAVTVSAVGGGIQAQDVPGIVDSRFEFNAGAATSVMLSQALRLYLAYDGRFRDGFVAHGATAGLEIRW